MGRFIPRMHAVRQNHHNGKLVQANMDFTNGVGGADICFMNLLQCAECWKTGTNPPLNLNDPDIMDDAGWLLPGAGSWRRIFLAPSTSERPGTYYIRGEGASQELRIGTNLNSVLIVPGAGPWSAALPTLNRDSEPPYNGGTMTILPPASGSDYSKNINLVHEDDLDDYDDGEIYDPQFISRARELGCIRFLNWIYTNGSMAQAWFDVVPMSAANWSFWCDKTRWTNNGMIQDAVNKFAYTCTYDGAEPFSLTRGCTIYAKFDEHSTPDAAVCTGFTVGNPTKLILDRDVSAKWTVGCDIGVNIFKMVGGGTQPMNTKLTRRKWELLGFESGGTVALIDVDTTGTANPGLSEYFRVGPIFTLDINGTGPKPLRGMTGYYPQCESWPADFSTAFDGSQMGFCAGNVAKIHYDPDYDEYKVFANGFAPENIYGLGGPAISTHLPYEAMIALCNKVGAHPWFPLPPMTCHTPGNNPTIADFTDYIPRLLDLCDEQLNSGLIPRLEPGNETLLYHTAVAAYFDTTMDLRNGYTNFYDQSNAVGYACSMIGQLCADHYGYAKADVKTQQHVQPIIPLMSAILFYDYPSASNDILWPRGASTTLVSYGGDPAYEWCNRICLADYWMPAMTTDYFASDATEIAKADAYVAAYDSADFVTAETLANEYTMTALVHGPLASAATFLDIEHPGDPDWGRIFIKLKQLCTETVSMWGGGFKACLYEGSYDNLFPGSVSANVRRLRKECRMYSAAADVTLELFHDFCDDGIGEFPSIYLMCASYEASWAATWYNSYDQTRPIYDAAVTFNNGG